jgi:hypothetical protein
MANLPSEKNMVENTDYKNEYPYTGIDDYELTFFYDLPTSIVVKWISPAGVLSDPKEPDVDYELVRIGATSYVRILIDFGTGGTFLAYRHMPYTQTYNGVDGREPSPSAIEAGMDRIVHQVQQVAGSVDGTLKVPANESMDMTIPSATARRGGIAAYADDANAQPIVLAGVTDTPVSTFMENPVVSESAVQFRGYMDTLSDTEIEARVDEAEETLYAGFAWEPVGSELTVTASGGYAGIAALSSTRIAYVDTTAATLVAYDFNGSTWSQVGNTLSVTSSQGSIAALSATRVALGKNGSLATYDFDGTNWSLVGSELSLGSVIGSAIAMLSSSRIAWIDTVNDEIRTYDFSGTAWSQVGNGLSFGPTTSARYYLAGLSSNRIVVYENTFQLLISYEFDGSDWAAVTDTTSVTDGYAMTLLNSRSVLVERSTLGVIQEWGVDGYDFFARGPAAVGVSDRSGARTQLEVLSSSLFVYQSGNSLQAYRRVKIPNPPAVALN